MFFCSGAIWLHEVRSSYIANCCKFSAGSLGVTGWLAILVVQTPHISILHLAPNPLLEEENQLGAFMAVNRISYPMARAWKSVLRTWLLQGNKMQGNQEYLYRDMPLNIASFNSEFSTKELRNY